jgi:hypothetical protein
MIRNQDSQSQVNSSLFDRSRRAMPLPVSNAIGTGHLAHGQARDIVNPIAIRHAAMILTPCHFLGIAD